MMQLKFMTNFVANDNEDEMKKAENSICPGRGMVCCHPDNVWDSNPASLSPSPPDIQNEDAFISIEDI